MVGMSLMFRLQLLAIATVIGANLTVRSVLWDAAPSDRMLAFTIFHGGFILWWIGAVLWIRLSHRLPEDTPEAWYGHTMQMFWFGNGATVACFLLVMPYAKQDFRLLVAMVCLAPVVVQVFGTIRTPGLPPRSVWASVVPAGIPLGLLVMFGRSGDAFAVPTVIYIASFTLAVLMLREVMQGWVDKAWAATRVAEAARDGRTRFLASASRDLGQPLQAARLFFDQAMSNPVGPARDVAVHGVNWDSATTETLLGQMLEHLRLEAGQLPVGIEPVTLGRVISTLAEMHEPAARLAKVDIIAMPTRLAVIGDRALIDRALGNLVTNALRHARARRVLVGARWTAGRVRIWVIDDGVGIPEADRPHLFEDHFQGSNHGDEVRGGFGLGLASTRRLAALMQGAAGIDQRWTRGSAFWIELPAA